MCCHLHSRKLGVSEEPEVAEVEGNEKMSVRELIHFDQHRVKVDEQKDERASTVRFEFLRSQIKHTTLNTVDKAIYRL